MNDDSAPAAQPRPRPLDLALVVIGPTWLAAGFGMFKGSPWYAGAGFLAGFALAALAWRWPKVAGPVLLVLSFFPGLAYGLVFTLYTLGMPQALVSLWGSAAFLAGGIGVLRRRSSAKQPMRYFVIGALAAVCLLYFVILWPPKGRAILLSLPILPPEDAPEIHADAGGIWAGYWTATQMTIPEALESVRGPLEADGWTIVDTSLHGFGIPLISAQRGVYSLEVIYEPKAPQPYWSTGAYLAAYVRRARARQFPEFDPPPPDL